MVCILLWSLRKLHSLGSWTAMHFVVYVAVFYLSVLIKQVTFMQESEKVRLQQLLPLFCQLFWLYCSSPSVSVSNGVKLRRNQTLFWKTLVKKYYTKFVFPFRLEQCSSGAIYLPFDR